MAVNVQKGSGGFSKSVGIFAGEPLAICPDVETRKSLGLYVDDQESEINYVEKVEEDGKKIKRALIKIVLQDLKTDKIFDCLNFYIKDKIDVAKTGNTLYVNSRGQSRYIDDPDNLPESFTKLGATYRKGYQGEKELLEFINSWWNINRKGEFIIDLNIKALLKGDFSELQDMIKSDVAQSVLCVAAIRTKQPTDEDGEIKQYQSIYNRRFSPGYNLKHFRAIQWTDEKLEQIAVINKDNQRKFKELKPIEQFVADVFDREYGCKDYTVCEELRNYKGEEEDIAAGQGVVDEKGTDY